MPTYEYECKRCGRVFELRQRISEPALTTHEGCGGQVSRLLSPAPFILKGEGWYVTDYPSEARKKAKEAEKGTGKKESADKGTTEVKPSTDSKPSADGKAADSAKTSSTTTSASSPASTSTSPAD